MAPSQRTHARTARIGRSAVSSCLILLFTLGGCDGKDDSGIPTGTPANRNNLSTMATKRISIDGHQFEVWLAKDSAQQQLGLMQVKEDELASFRETIDGKLSDINRGMLFVFQHEQPLSFWMRNTIIPLDIAYIRSDGRIVSTYTMAPLETRVYPSGEPALYALEVKAGVFASLGIKVGDSVQIPD